MSSRSDDVVVLPGAPRPPARSSTFAHVASRLEYWRRGLFGGEALIRPSEVGTDR